MNETLKNIIENMGEIDAAIKSQDTNIENIAMKIAIQNQVNNETFEKIEKDSKLNIKETLNTKRTANNNQFEILNLNKKVETHALKLNATSVIKTDAW